MASRQDSEGDEGEIRVNGISGRAAVYDRMVRSIQTGIAISVCVGIFVEWRDYRDFRAGAVGNRFTEQQGAALERRVALLEDRVNNLPPRWLQQQIEQLKQETEELNIKFEKLLEKVGPK